jgi:hypothetical protein
MEEPRVLRFAITPFVFWFWVALSYVDLPSAEPLKAFTPALGKLPLLAGAIAGSAIPLGFLISSLTVGTLRLRPGMHYEATNLGARVSASEAVHFRTATLAHIHSRETLSAWINRRWSAFMTSANCVLATELAIVVGYAIHWPCSVPWWWTVTAGGTVLVLANNARRAHEETHGMLRYQEQTKGFQSNQAKAQK